MREETTRLITVTDATTSGSGSVVETRSTNYTQATERRNSSESERARLFLNVTSLTAGASPTLDVDIVHVIDSVDIVIGSFAQITEGGGTGTIVIEACPSDLKVVYTTGGTVADADFTVDCMRF